MHPGRKRLIFAVLLVMIGSFLPWLLVGSLSVSGARGPGLWTFYASVLGLAGVLLPFPRISGWHAVVLAAVAIGLPVWQLVHVIRLVGFGGWSPGPGMVMVVAGGVLAAACARQLLRRPVED